MSAKKLTGKATPPNEESTPDDGEQNDKPTEYTETKKEVTKEKKAPKKLSAADQKIADEIAREIFIRACADPRAITSGLGRKIGKVVNNTHEFAEAFVRDERITD